MYNGKMKAVTFSYDDGVTQDLRLIEILDKYGLKATFNLNSELLGTSGCLEFGGKKVSHNKVQPGEVKKIYKNHEVAVHTLTHPLLTELPAEEIIRQVEQDRLNLERLTGSSVVGMAYPCGGVNNDERVAEIIGQNTKISYARTITSTYGFGQQDNPLRFNPSVYHIMEKEQLFTLAESFIKLTPDKPSLFYIWGHSYEFDIEDTWELFEDFCRLISGRDDICYAVNRELIGRYL